MQTSRGRDTFAPYLRFERHRHSIATCTDCLVGRAMHCLPFTRYSKERKEREQFVSRLTGKQIYEQRRTGTTAGPAEEDVEEEDAQMVDWTQYEREQPREEEEEDHGLVYSDSD